LCQANLKNANIDDASFLGANLEEADLTGENTRYYFAISDGTTKTKNMKL